MGEVEETATQTDSTEGKFIVETDPMNTVEVNEAAKYFQDTASKVRGLSNELSFRALRRVFLASEEFPFGTSKSESLSEKEKELYLLCLARQQAKGVMNLAILEQNRLLKQKELDNKQTTPPIVAESAGIDGSRTET